MSANGQSIEDLLDSSPEISLADPALAEAAAKLVSTIWTSGSEGLGVLLGRGVLYTEGSCAYNEAASLLPGEGIFLELPVEWSGDRNGRVRLYVPEDGAKAIVATLMATMTGSEPDPENTELDEEGLDGFKEAMSQFLGAASQALRQDPGGEVKLEPQPPERIDFGETPASERVGEELVLVDQGQLMIEGASPCEVYTVLDTALTGVEISIPERQDTGGEAAGEAGDEDELARIRRLQIPSHVTLADRRMRLSEIMKLVPGSIVEFKKPSETFLDFCIGHIVIARGEAVIVDEHFGLQLREVLSLRDVLAQTHPE